MRCQARNEEWRKKLKYVWDERAAGISYSVARSGDWCNYRGRRRQLDDNSATMQRQQPQTSMAEERAWEMWPAAALASIPAAFRPARRKRGVRARQRRTPGSCIKYATKARRGV